MRRHGASADSGGHSGDAEIGYLDDANRAGADALAAWGGHGGSGCRDHRDDPQPMLAEPAYCLIPFMRNRWPVVARSADMARALRRRFDILTSSASVDRPRARAWLQARAVDDLPKAVEHGDNEGVSHRVSLALAEMGDVVRRRLP